MLADVANNLPGAHDWDDALSEAQGDRAVEAGDTATVGAGFYQGRPLLRMCFDAAGEHLVPDPDG